MNDAIYAALRAYREHVAESHHEYEIATVLDWHLSELLGAEILKGHDHEHGSHAETV